ncbi:hypothetical protein G2W53_013175 [Senna tora]|uniref:Uncharacterized protein n=1 Tax=Senna tora TaxID=362788 RepID=A0A834WQD5_9FABA|nr:hypothetical protein G2W53_013175 [Senna tora]
MPSYSLHSFASPSSSFHFLPPSTSLFLPLFSPHLKPPFCFHRQTLFYNPKKSPPPFSNHTPVQTHWFAAPRKVATIIVCGAHPMILPIPAVLSKNPSGKTSLSSEIEYSPANSLESLGGGLRKDHKKRNPLLSRALQYGPHGINRGITIREGLHRIGFKLLERIYDKTLGFLKPLDVIEEEFLRLLLQHHRRENISRDRVHETRNRQLGAGVLKSRRRRIQTVPVTELEKMKFEAEKCGAGGEEDHGRNLELVGDVDHGGAEHVDDEGGESRRVRAGIGGVNEVGDRIFEQREAFLNEIVQMEVWVLDSDGDLMMKTAMEKRWSWLRRSLANSTAETRWPIPGEGTNTSSDFVILAQCMGTMD